MRSSVTGPRGNVKQKMENSEMRGILVHRYNLKLNIKVVAPAWSSVSSKSLQSNEGWVPERIFHPQPLLGIDYLTSRRIELVRP
jgi:hypothetical protein